MNYLVDEGYILQEDIEAYKYTLEMFWDKFLVYGCILVISMLAKCFVETALFLLCFNFIRKYTGGFHLNTFRQCFVGTVTIYIVFILWLSSLLLSHNMATFAMTIGSALYLLCVGTVNHPNWDLSEEELRACKLSSRYVVGMMLLGVVFLKWLGVHNMTFVFIQFSVILSAVLVLLARLQRGDDSN